MKPKTFSTIFLITVFVSLSCQFISFSQDSKRKPLSTESVASNPLTTQTPTEGIASLGELSYKDRPDDNPDKYQIHVLYVVPKDFTDTTRYFDGSIEDDMLSMNKWFYEQTDGQAFVLDTYQGKLDVTYIQLPVTDEEFFIEAAKKYENEPNITMMQLISHGMEDYFYQMDELPLKPRKLYVAYFEISKVSDCGWSQSGKGYLVAKVFPSAYNVRDNINCSEDGSKMEYTIAHEIIHLLGFPSEYTCYSHPVDGGAHIFDPNSPDDIMGIGVYGQHPVLDPEHDDYFLIEKSCLDLADTPYLYP